MRILEWGFQIPLFLKFIRFFAKTWGVYHSTHGTHGNEDPVRMEPKSNILHIAPVVLPIGKFENVKLNLKLDFAVIFKMNNVPAPTKAADIKTGF